MVKILEKGDKFNYTEEQLKEMAKGNYEGTEYPREGIVLRLQKNWYPDEDNRYSFKYVNDDFLTYNLLVNSFFEIFLASCLAIPVALINFFSNGIRKILFRVFLWKYS